MADPQKALQTQLANIEKRTGQSLAELAAILKASGLNKHGELRDYLKRELAMGHGDANTLVHAVLGAQGTGAHASPAAASSDVLSEIYVGPKAALRPIHEKLMAAIQGFGEFEVAPKKGYVSLRRKRQFATLGPATNSRFELGLNMKGVPGTDRLAEVPPGGMCSHKVKLTAADEVDSDVINWVRRAFDGAG